MRVPVVLPVWYGTESSAASNDATIKRVAPKPRRQDRTRHTPHRISFHWGPKDPGEKNFISCRGQRLELGKSAGECRILHILAASTDQDVLTGMKLVFQEPTSQSIDLYAFQASPWDRPRLLPAPTIRRTSTWTGRINAPLAFL
jgi:hypothetical protein